MERSLLDNGRFLQNINSWVQNNASYLASDGDDHFGVAILATGGGYIEQDFAVPDVRLYTLHLAVKGIGVAITNGQVTARITDGDGNTVVTYNLTADADTWTESNNTPGLTSGTTYTLRLTNVSASGNVYFDDVWMWFVPVTRAQIATRVHAKLGRLATERSLTTIASGALTEGSYTYAIDATLRVYGAINSETGLPDVRYLDENQVQAVIELARVEILEFLQTEYAVEVDTTTGPYSQNLSQKADIIGKIIAGGKGSGGGSSSGSVIQRNLNHNNGWDV